MDHSQYKDLNDRLERIEKLLGIGYDLLGRKLDSAAATQSETHHDHVPTKSTNPAGSTRG